MTFEEMAQLYARVFEGQGRAWHATEFEALTESPHGFVVSAAHGFALGRAVLDEAELLTLVVDPLQRRQGMGQMLLSRFEEEAQRRGASQAFLEVAADNHAARALYDVSGYRQGARRTGYYTRPGRAAVTALVLRKSIGDNKS